MLIAYTLDLIVAPKLETSGFVYGSLPTCMHKRITFPFNPGERERERERVSGKGKVRFISRALWEIIEKRLYRDVLRVIK